MEEKIIIKMENRKIKKMSKRVKIIVCIILALLSLFLTAILSSAISESEYYYTERDLAKKYYEESETLQKEYSSFNKYLKDLKKGIVDYKVEVTKYSYLWDDYHTYTETRNDFEDLYLSVSTRWVFCWIITLLVPAGFILLTTLYVLILNFILSRPELVLTNKRMYGKNTFGRRMDLPVDSITSVSTTKLLKGLRVATSSGTIKFYNLANLKDFHKETANLLIERQNVKKVSETENIKKEIVSSADELKKYKELLDMGAISQEEFDAKKKQILGL